MRKKRPSLNFPLTVSAALGAALLAGSVQAAADDDFGSSQKTDNKAR